MTRSATAGRACGSGEALAGLLAAVQQRWRGACRGKRSWLVVFTGCRAPVPCAPPSSRCQHLGPHLGPILFQASCQQGRTGHLQPTLPHLQLLALPGHPFSPPSSPTSASPPVPRLLPHLHGWRAQGAGAAEQHRAARPPGWAVAARHPERIPMAGSSAPSTHAPLSTACRLRRLGEVLPDGHPFVFEFRDASWLCEEVYAVLRERGWALAISHCAGARCQRSGHAGARTAAQAMDATGAWAGKQLPA